MTIIILSTKLGSRINSLKNHQKEIYARGCSGTSPAANASRLRCIKPDVQSADVATIDDQVEGEEGEENVSEEGEEGEENVSEDDQDEEEDDE